MRKKNLWRVRRRHPGPAPQFPEAEFAVIPKRDDLHIAEELLWYLDRAEKDRKYFRIPRILGVEIAGMLRRTPRPMRGRKPLTLHAKMLIRYWLSEIDRLKLQKIKGGQSPGRAQEGAIKEMIARAKKEDGLILNLRLCTTN